jgi:hypothetical protein
VQVEARATDDECGDTVTARGFKGGGEKGQPAPNGRLLMSPEHAVEAMWDLGCVRRPRLSGQDRQIGEQLLTIGVDDDAADPTSQFQCQGGLAAGGAATYDNQRLDWTSPDPPAPESRCRP